jgi:hypothetical protein
VIFGIQTANDPSRLHDAIKFPAGAKHTSFTEELCPVNLKKIFDISISQFILNFFYKIIIKSCQLIT